MSAELRAAAEMISDMRDRPDTGPVVKIARGTWYDCLRIADAYIADSTAQRQRADDLERRLREVERERDEAIAEQERLRIAAVEVAKDFHTAMRFAELTGVIKANRCKEWGTAERMRPISGQYIDRVAELETELEAAKAENARLTERVRTLKSLVGMVRYCHECGHCPCCGQRGTCDDDCDMAKEQAAKALEDEAK